MSISVPKYDHPARFYMNSIDGEGLSVAEACKRAEVTRQSYYDWRDKLSETDKEMEDSSPGFYKFNEAELDKVCVQCQYKDGKPVDRAKTFKTRLPSNRFCKRSHRPLRSDGA